MILDWLNQHLGVILRVVGIGVIGFPVVVIFSRLLGKALTKKVSQQTNMLIAKVTLYAGFALIISMMLTELGLKLTAFLGAAGIAGIALGFAAQTSLSNLISGVFLILEAPFQIGDWIRLDQYTGIVHAIDLLSIRVRTFDNTLIRIPNEMVIKTPVTTVTAFPIRRMDITIRVAFKEDIPTVVKLLREAAAETPDCLDEPEPFVLFREFSDSAMEFLFGVWFLKDDFIAVRNAILPTIKRKFDENGIEIPIPHRSLYAGRATEPFPIRIVNNPIPPFGDNNEQASSAVN